MTHEERRLGLGAYVLGALDPAERADLEAHLGECSLCRAELAELAGLPGLLSRLPLDDVTTGGAPGPGLLPRVLAAVEQERARRHRATLRWRGAAGLAAAGLAGVLLLGPGLGSDGGRQRLTAAAGVAASGTAALQPRPWGTSIRLRLSALPGDGGPYTAWALDTAGRRTPVASWGRTRDGAADVTGASALSRPQLAGLVVTTAQGAPLLRLGQVSG